MSKRFISKFIILATLQACIVEVPFEFKRWNQTINVDNMSFHDATLAMQAAEEWNEACNTNIRLSSKGTVVDRASGTIDCGDSKDVWGCSDAAEHKWLLITHSLDDLASLATFKHEMGHLLGIVHTQQGIMRAGINPSDAIISQIDCEEIPENGKPNIIP